MNHTNTSYKKTSVAMLLSIKYFKAKSISKDIKKQ